MTYRQAKDLGGQVRKGEKAAAVVYLGAIERTETNDNGEDEESPIPFLKKALCVFNADQVDGLPDRFRIVAMSADAPITKQRMDHADAFFANTGAAILNGGNRASYQLANNCIAMPLFEAFVSAEAHAAPPCSLDDPLDRA
ncbi:ArdC-like ssDNA-binding domain-containing protein [Devosia sp. UYZn731]|uniref:ArdC-like ssDNA-binding domain-containing protein n=1 Tax=Devosia sp. UYZn731 TaxID=3156345 RepID=UPI0033949073